MFLWLLILISGSTCSKLPPSLEDEVHMTVPEIITKYNRTVEIHNVVTEDGYILTLHRIVPSISKGPVLIMHGIVASSADWIITGPHHGLGYQLLDEGYDVWLGNARGNRYSRQHSSLDPESNEFWDFSWHEIGLYDIPAMIDYILLKTQEEQLFYIAHSQGTTAFYVMCSLKPEYNQKIRAQFSLAPVAYVKHMTSPVLRLLAVQYPIFKHLVKWFDIDEVLPKGGAISLMGQAMCGINALTTLLCSNTLFLIAGFNSKQLNTTLLPLILAHVPAGSSARQMLHFAQEINSGHFRQYDNGIITNLKKYGSWKPPDYDLSKITTPIYFFYGANDWIASARDVQLLSTQLRNLRGKFRVGDEAFNHLDFMFGIEAPTLVYNKILSLMTRH